VIQRTVPISLVNIRITGSMVAAFTSSSAAAA
jgi:hypothetical protein